MDEQRDRFEPSSKFELSPAFELANGRWRTPPPVPAWLVPREHARRDHSMRAPVIPPLRVKAHREGRSRDTVYLVLDADGLWVFEAREAFIADWFVAAVNEHWEPEP